MVEFLLLFVFTSFVTAVVLSFQKESNPRRALLEASRFAGTIIVGIGVFSLVVFALGYLFQ